MATSTAGEPCGHLKPLGLQFHSPSRTARVLGLIPGLAQAIEPHEDRFFPPLAIPVDAGPYEGHRLVGLAARHEQAASSPVTPRVELRGLPLAHVAGAPLRGVFLERLNRFVARVRLAEGPTVLAHLPNPGRLTGTLVPGCSVLLDGPYEPPRRCLYTLVAAREGKVWVCTVTTYANRLFPELWARGLFPELQGSQLRAEVPAGHSRFDFQAGEWLIEVKSVTLAGQGTGYFPDAVTERGQRHVRELAQRARRGGLAAVVFVAQRADVLRIAPAAHIDPAFARALWEAHRAGVALLACSLHITPRGARAAWRVPVELRAQA